MINRKILISLAASIITISGSSYANANIEDKSSVVKGISVEKVDSANLDVLKSNIRTALESTKDLGIRDFEARRLRNSVDLMANIISNISPGIDKNKISNSMMKSISKLGVNDGFIKPALNVVDKAIMFNHIGVADMINPIISEFNPELSQTLTRELGIQGDFGLDIVGDRNTIRKGINGLFKSNSFGLKDLNSSKMNFKSFMQNNLQGKTGTLDGLQLGNSGINNQRFGGFDNQGNAQMSQNLGRAQFEASKYSSGGVGPISQTNINQCITACNIEAAWDAGRAAAEISGGVGAVTTSGAALLTTGGAAFPLWGTLIAGGAAIVDGFRDIADVADDRNQCHSECRSKVPTVDEDKKPGEDLPGKEEDKDKDPDTSKKPQQTDGYGRPVDEGEDSTSGTEEQNKPRGYVLPEEEDTSLIYERPEDNFISSEVSNRRPSQRINNNDHRVDRDSAVGSHHENNQYRNRHDGRRGHLETSSHHEDEIINHGHQ